MGANDPKVRCECGSTDFEQDLAAGTTCCIQCGIVLEENVITSEITFTEGPGGAMRMDGQFINNDASGPSTMGSHGRRMNTGLSREQTIAHARERLRRLTAAVGGLTDQHLEHALRVFKLALNINFTKGRRSEVVAGACLYIACRDSGTKHLLIDFSDTLQVSVFILGGTFSKLVKTLGLPMNYVDPSAYIERFASRMDLGEKKRAVADDATRLLARMQRDWIVAGRRPNGLCGACLLIASRMHGFKRTEQEIMIIVKIGEQTIKNRLSEFAQTDAATITVHDFRQHQEDHSIDSMPPSFMRAREKESLSNRISDQTLKDQVSASLQLMGTSLAEETPSEQIEVKRATERPLGAEMITPVASAPPAEEETDELRLSDLDDEELDAFLLDEEEVQQKTEAWEKENQAFFENQEAKRKLREQQERPKRTHNRAFHFTSQRPAPSTTAEAVELVLQNKAPHHSKKLNLDAMKYFEEKQGGEQEEEEEVIEEQEPVNKRSNALGRRLSMSGRRKPLMGGLRSTFAPRIRGTLNAATEQPSAPIPLQFTTTATKAPAKTTLIQPQHVIQAVKSKSVGPRQNYLKEVLGNFPSDKAHREEEIVIEEAGHVPPAEEEPEEHVEEEEEEEIFTEDEEEPLYDHYEED